MKEGSIVRFIQPVIQGTILDTRYNKDANELEHLVTWGSGEDSGERWFLASQLEEV